MSRSSGLDCTGCGVCDVACPSGLSPRRLVAAAARALADEPIAVRPADTGLDAEPRAPHRRRDARRLSLALAALRLGLGEQPPEPPWDSSPVRPRRVAIPLKQSLGVAACPRAAPGDPVTCGDRIADAPEGAVAVAMHASVDGVIAEIDAGAIVIEAETSTSPRA